MSGDRPSPAAAEVIGATAPFIPGGVLAEAWFDDTDIGAADTPAADTPTADRVQAEAMGEARRASFLAGRRALRAALQRVEAGATGAIPSTPRGAPALPAHLTGSISHKRRSATVPAGDAPARGRAIAIAAPAFGQTVGVDLEFRPTADELARPDIAPRILTARELAMLPTGDARQRADTTRLAFALKEAVYKAIDPAVQRYVGFTEVELEPDRLVDFQQSATTGLVTVRLLMSDPAAQPLQLRAMWQMDATWIIALARATAAT